MERTKSHDGSAEAWGGGAVRRFLTRAGLQLLGLSEEEGEEQKLSWWDNKDDAQEEFWTEDGSVVSLSVSRVEKHEAASAGGRVTEDEVRGGIRDEEFIEGRIEKGNVMSMLAIAKFLRINGSVYDGSDRGRWLAVPSAKAALPYQLMKAPKQPGGFFRSFRSLPRDFAGINTYRMDSYAGK